MAGGWPKRATDSHLDATYWTPEQRVIIVAHLREPLISRRGIFLLDAQANAANNEYRVRRETATVFPALASNALNAAMVEALLNHHALALCPGNIAEATIDGVFVPDARNPILFLCTNCGAIHGPHEDCPICCHSAITAAVYGTLVAPNYDFGRMLPVGHPPVEGANVLITAAAALALYGINNLDETAIANAAAVAAHLHPLANRFQIEDDEITGAL
ncbi:hypothetical protein PLESTM_001486500 [Pleodorina starrii]|nr:hypothetical protein PLESTM_001486500 [Pleodorina starrii]